jgi:gliding motility-associated protein GldM
MTAGGIGEQTISGQFGFLEDGKEIPLKFEGTYVVVPRPNSATISADKMNVVYRGVDNPMTISFAGVSNDKVKASAPGMSGTNGKYTLRPGAGSNVMVTVSATLPDGKVVSDKKEFRIKGIPAPTGKIRGEVSASGSKSNLEVCTITAELIDFDFPIKAQVTQFTIKVPGQPSKVVSGSKMDAAAKSAIAKASKGDVVSIFDIKAKFVGGAENQLVKGISPCSFEIK